ncbi:hypothetical protein BD779DRAFT_1741349 [Infundibulicybe gibba]|nr:hypothetical protein BD779DRAFT_1741349 [Infundibulicybe gibba]
MSASCPSGPVFSVIPVPHYPNHNRRAPSPGRSSLSSPSADSGVSQKPMGSLRTLFENTKVRAGRERSSYYIDTARSILARLTPPWVLSATTKYSIPVSVYTSNLHQELALLISALHNYFDQLGAQLSTRVFASMEECRIANLSPRVIRRNSQRLPGQVEPSQKTKRGHGLALAQTLARGLDPTGLQDLVAPLNPPAIGATLPNFPSDISRW